MRFDERAVLLVARGGAAVGAEAIGHLGARPIGPVAPEAFEDARGADLVLIEADDLDDDTLAALLERVAAIDVPLVVAFTQAQIDLVAAYLLASDAALLCAPSMAERVAALAIALGGAGDRLREEDEARIAALHAEIARLAEAIARLTRGDGPPPGLADRRPVFRGEVPAAPSAADVRALLRARRLRDDYFGAGLFEDPAWDVLLDLYAAEIEGTRVSVSSLCIAAAVAPTTALRWIARMTDQGLIDRVPDPRDRRRAFLSLSRESATAMARYWVARQALLAGR
ncbi:MAG: hypothetical protein K2X76_10255 [Sphingomonas sp.]|nr:hypothetical protein [Sphingomonas sp.]